jgi:hypothetical protein
VGGLGERVRPRSATPSSRKALSNSLTPTLSRPATRHPRAGPAGGPELPDKLSPPEISQGLLQGRGQIPAAIEGVHMN